MILNMLAEGFSDSSFARLFSEMNPFVIAMFIIGIVFCVIELLIPGFGFFGISGIVLVCAAIVVRMVMGGDALMLLYMLLLSAVLFGLLFLLMGKFIRSRQKNENSMFSVKSAVPDGLTEGTADYTSLVDRTGIATTILRPVGRAEFDGKPVDVVARDGFVDKGATVKVVAVEGSTVTVVKVDDTNKTYFKEGEM